jgi:hypothetical protein
VIFDVEIKTDGENLQRGDLYYEKRKLYRVEEILPARGQRLLTVKFRLIGKINLDRQLSTDRAVPRISNSEAAARYRSLCK